MFDAGMKSLRAFSSYNVSPLFSDLTSTPQYPCINVESARRESMSRRRVAAESGDAARADGSPGRAAFDFGWQATEIVNPSRQTAPMTRPRFGIKSGRIISGRVQ